MAGNHRYFIPMQQNVPGRCNDQGSLMVTESAELLSPCLCERCCVIKDRPVSCTVGTKVAEEMESGKCGVHGCHVAVCCHPVPEPVCRHVDMLGTRPHVRHMTCCWMMCWSLQITAKREYLCGRMYLADAVTKVLYLTEKESNLNAWRHVQCPKPSLVGLIVGLVADFLLGC